MKKIIFLFVFSAALAAPYILFATEPAGVRDTSFYYRDKTIILTDSGDSFKTSVVESGDTVLLEKKDPKSSIKVSGSDYNFIFSWNKKKFDPHWSGFGMSFINFDNLKGADLKQSISYSFVLNLMEYYVPIDRYHWLFVTGMGIDWSRYHFKGNTGLTEKDGITFFEPSPEEVNYKSSKLLSYYITLPLLLEYQTKISKKRDFFVSGGLVGYIKCYSKSQVEYRTSEGKKQENKGRDLNILPVNARFMLQIGIDDISLFGYYSPFSLFKKDKGPEIYPVGVGLMLGF